MLMFFFSSGFEKYFPDAQKTTQNTEAEAKGRNLLAPACSSVVKGPNSWDVVVHTVLVLVLA